MDITKILGYLILAVWIFMVSMITWDESQSEFVNIVNAILIILLFGAIHWLPFWLIFVR